jgi:DNA-directed RNA polymerase specialized sigma subunit
MHPRGDPASQGAYRARGKLTTKRRTIQLTITEDQLIEAAQQLGQDEFTRADVAEKLGVEKPELKQAFVHARKAGRLEKVRDDEENTGYFRLI